MDQNFCTICSRNAYRMTGRKYGTDLAVCRSVNMSVLRDHSNALTEDFLSEGRIRNLLNADTFSLHRCCKLNPFILFKTIKKSHFSFLPFF